MKLKLDAKSVAALTVPSGKAEEIFWDATLDRFGLRLRRARSGDRVLRSWLIQYRPSGGGSRRMVIGSADVLSPDQARTAARKALAKVDLGDDPQADRAERRDMDRTRFRAVVAEYIEARRPHWALSSYQHNVTYLTRNYFKPLHGMPIDRITRRDAAQALLAIERRHGAISAGQARSKISAFFVWCMRTGLIDANPMLGTVRFAAAPPRERVLSDAELAAIWSACEGNDDYPRIIRLSMLLPCRRQEVGGMRWDELDLHAATWTIPAARCKNKRTTTLPLLPMALDIINSVPRRADRDHLFGQRHADGFFGWAKGKARIDAKLKLRPWTVHDIRRSVATRMADIGVQPHIIEQILNHQSGHKRGVAGIYNRSSYEREVRAALALWADHVNALVTGGERKVVALHPK
jgi:integrase